MDDLELALHQNATCYDYIKPSQCPGLKGPYAYADYEDCDVRMNIEGPADIVVRVLKYLNAGCPDFEE